MAEIRRAFHDLLAGTTLAATLAVPLLPLAPPIDPEVVDTHVIGDGPEAEPAVEVRLGIGDVEACSCNHTALEGRHEVGSDHGAAAADVDEVGAPAHRRDGFCAEQAAGRRCIRQDADQEIRPRQEVRQLRDRPHAL